MAGWLETPAGLVYDLAARIEQRYAEDSLRSVTAFALGGGTLQQADSQRIMRQLERIANGPERPKLTEQDAELILAEFGIDFVKG